MPDVDTLLTQLRDQLGPLEQLRQETAAKRQRALWIMLAVLVVGVLLTLLFSRWAIWSAIVAGFVSIATLAGIYFRQISEPFAAFRRRFKHQIITSLLGSMAEEVRYAPDGDRRILAEYHHSELFPRQPDREQIEDTLFARIGQTDVSLSELHTEYKETTRDKDGKTKTTWHTIFRGLFISADFHKEFRGKTFVRSDLAEKLFGQSGRFIQKPVFSNFQLIQLEDPDFEREFVVYAIDQVEARYILSPALMQRMLELKHRFAAQVEFSFLHSRVYIAISTSRNFFEPRLDASLYDLETLRGFLEQVQLCLGIVSALDLNTRIWSKA